MKVLYILYTYNRGFILEKSIKSLFNLNNKFRPTELLILDDGSEVEIKDSLYQFARNNTDLPIHFISFARNQGLGYNWELAWNWVRCRDFDYVVQLEADYVWREDAIAEAIEVLECKPLSLAVSGYSNPDFWNDKKDWLFRKVMIDEFGEDPAKREFLHKPFKIDTKFGKVEIQLTTNSCGTFILKWQNGVKTLLNKYPDMWERCFEKSFNKPYPERRKSAGDGPITSGLSYYWYKDKEEADIDYSVESPWLDICDASLSQHFNGGFGSLNGYIVPEGSTFVGSPKWKDEYLVNNPRKTS